MKHTLKQRKQQPKNVPAARPANAPPDPSPPRRWAVLGFCLLLVGGGTWAVLELGIWSKIPSRLVGKWVIEGGDQDGATLDFFRNGTMVGRMNVRGDLAIVRATVTVDGNKLFITTRNPNTQVDETRVQIIKTLTAGELVLEDDQGKVFRLAPATN